MTISKKQLAAIVALANDAERRDIKAELREDKAAAELAAIQFPNSMEELYRQEALQTTINRAKDAQIVESSRIATIAAVLDILGYYLECDPADDETGRMEYRAVYDCDRPLNTW